MLGASLLAARLAALLHPTDVSRMWEPGEAESPDDLAACEAERCATEEVIADFEVVDLEGRAAKARYRGKNGKPGKLKRTRYPRVSLAKRRVVVSLHQPGVERTEARWRQTADRVTSHRFIGPTGVRYRQHPLETRLVATNRLDRAPWHAIAIEVAGNFERLDGTGTWWNPDRFGRGRATDAQIEATRVEIASLCEEVSELGGEVEAIVPHIIAGRDRNGRPNRQACCGSRVWSEAGEWAGAVLGLSVPAPGFALGGLPVPDAWHGPYWGRCDRFLTG